MIIYGRNPVREAIAAGRRPVKQIWAAKGAIAEFGGARPASNEEIAKLAGTDAHQGVCADVAAYHYVGAHELLARKDPLIVVLDEIQDPQNLGAIARTAEAAGADGLVIPDRRSAEVTPSACKASAGAVEYLPIARVRNIADFLGEAKAAGHWIYGAAGDGQAYDTVDYSGGRVLVMGAEGTGLRPRVRETCDVLVALPQRGRIESLNVSAAAAVLVYAMVAGN
ncbi:MAG TPA: 23S rRNA (guanosine(2251)-2'-O)-methyltransferase RlmB [Baekduia sp.]|nr:23S rRNA (guanosine(2251)-2'-O)-methyltransferase RlmB [Baekduia sp.]